ncbi:MAG: hypothetical protein M1836_007351 [Candelina mexicana]|nr:MAG: hypothetical protein M1836_007351 [Candelina mexicana]
MSESTGSVKVDVFLETVPRVCDLSGRHPFRVTVCVKICDPRTITLQTTGSLLDPTAAFREGRIAIIDIESGNPIPGFADTENKTSPEQPSFVTLSGASYAESLYKIHFSTRLGASHEEGHLFPFDCSGLKAGHRYALKFLDSGVTWWRFGTQAEVLTQEVLPKPLEPSEAGTLEFISRRTPDFQAVPALPKPPKVSVSLSTSSDICHMSGETPFTVTVSFTSYAAKPITVVAAFRTPFDQLYADIIDAETKETVALGNHIIACPAGGASYRAEDFITLRPKAPFLQQITLNPVLDRNDIGSRSPHTYMDKFVDGRSYVVRLKGRMFGSKLRWWSYDSIEEVLQYAGTIEDSSLPYVPSIPLGFSQEVRFTAVDS